MTAGRKHDDISVDANVTDVEGNSKSAGVLNPKMEGRKNEFEAFMNTMYPICSKWATHALKGSGVKNTDKNPTAESTSQVQTTMAFMGFALQIWISKMVRNQ